ncbi:Na(+)/H(+) antiporter subunit B [Legionella antarctica]|uniref:Na(+)/H(+) antiporter subunit B n=1 Tax=Legionella antarctica TaxID=2708020 RepID=A0A6F8T748_9GAMM|nr:Na+/H+ antiporter subunit B [Legionella antarctica]BCA95786.1 Na(+)/H(+) antiporter subunit B [Legionella antarctica]
MKSLILRTASNFLLVITLLFSIWVLFRGHNSPGGGFIAGLIAASGFALYLLAHGAQALRGIIRVKLSLLLASGFIFGLTSGLIALLQNKNFLTGIWINTKYIHGQIGSPILFDIGVYLVVLGSILVMILALEESI